LIESLKIGLLTDYNNISELKNCQLMGLALGLENTETAGQAV